LCRWRNGLNVMWVFSHLRRLLFHRLSFQTGQGPVRKLLFPFEYGYDPEFFPRNQPPTW